jgi:hypothetical protein
MMKDSRSRIDEGEVNRRRAALKAVPPKQRREIAESATRARWAKTKRSRQPHD